MNVIFSRERLPALPPSTSDRLGPHKSEFFPLVGPARSLLDCRAACYTWPTSSSQMLSLRPTNFLRPCTTSWLTAPLPSKFGTRHSLGWGCPAGFRTATRPPWPIGLPRQGRPFRSHSARVLHRPLCWFFGCPGNTEMIVSSTGLGRRRRLFLWRSRRKLPIG
jgi:hypothetical protein